MRKILLSIAFGLMFGVSGGFAQVCTPLPIPIPGVYPNPLITSSLPDGQLGANYVTNITIVVIPDTTIDLSIFAPGSPIPLPTINVEVEYQKITGFSGLPAGLSHACNISNCVIPGDSLGCAQISGIPTTAGDFAVGLETVLGLLIPASVPIIGGTVQELPIPGIGWDMRVAGGVGIEELATDRFSVVQNGPNPFRGQTEITYHAPKPAKVSFTVMDLSGHILHERSERASEGTNVLTFDATGYAAGIYLYRLSNGEQAVTEKMIVVD